MFPTSTRFLLVDDYSTMRKVMKKILNDMGYLHIFEAVDGKNAFETLQAQHQKNEPIDFVISDWNMPNLLGIDLLKKCRESTQFRTVHFMLVTAESEGDQIRDAVKAGVSEYILKPYSPQKIKEKIESIYRKKQNSPNT